MQDELSVYFPFGNTKKVSRPNNINIDNYIY